MSLTAASAGQAASLSSIPLAQPQTSHQSGKPVAADRAEASRLAQQVDEPVEVMSLRDDYSQTFVNPDGTLTLDWSVLPQRVEQPDGSWADLDQTLQFGGDGRVEPAADVNHLSFSSAGDGSDAISMSRGSESLTFDWPTALPPPTLSGPTATYSDVVPGVDLLLTATVDGYDQSLVVKTPSAAQNPLLSSLHLTIRSSGLTLHSTTSGGVVALDSNGDEVFDGPPGMMWDSSAGSGQSQVRRSVSTGSGSAGAMDEPGGGDHTAPVAVEVLGDQMVVEPDQDFLTDPDTAFPVYIDPTVGLDATAWTMLMHDNTGFTQAYWKFAGNAGVGHCGDGCYNSVADQWPHPYTKRQFFQWNQHNKLAGVQVLSAKFSIDETWSYSCDLSRIDLVRSNHITSGTQWPGPGGWVFLASESAAYGYSGDCPAGDLEFSSDALDQAVQHYANGDYGSLFTLGLHAHDESAANGWKRLKGSSAHLEVTYVPQPGTATEVGVSTNFSDFDCSHSSDDPMISSSPTPSFRATLHTRVFHESPPAYLRGEFVLQEWQGADSHWDPVDPTLYAPDAGAGVPAGRVVSVQSDALADGNRYRMRARVDSGDDGGSGGQDHHWIQGPYSDWCYFNVDTSGPAEPSIDSSDYPDDGLPHGGPYQTGDFTITADSHDHDISQLRWRVTNPIGQVTDWQTINGSSGTVQFTPHRDGNFIMTAQASDGQRWGGQAEHDFLVSADSPEVGLWHLAGTADCQAAGGSCADDTTDGSPHPLTLMSGAAWDNRGRLQNRQWAGDEDGSLRLDGVASYAETAVPTLHTGASFTVSAEALLTDDSESATVVSQSDPTTGAGYNLYYSAPAAAWTFSWHWIDSNGIKQSVRSHAAATNPPVNIWTHLAAVYDADASTLQLYVNGEPQDAVAVSGDSVPIQASGPMEVGRTWLSGDASSPVYGDYLPGLVDEIHVWQRMSGKEEIQQQAEEPGDDDTNGVALVADWNADVMSSVGSGAALPDLSLYNRGGLALSASGASFDPDSGTVSLDGSGYLSTGGALLDETGSFTLDVTMQPDLASLEVGVPQRLVGQTGAPSSNQPDWAVWFSKTSDNPDGSVSGNIFFGRWDPDTASWVTAPVNGDQTVEVQAGALAEVTVIYDAQSDLMALLWNHQEIFPEQTQMPPGWQGDGDVTVGMAPTDSGDTDWFTGSFRQFRLWTGAMTVDQAAGLDSNTFDS